MVCPYYLIMLQQPSDTAYMLLVHADAALVFELRAPTHASQFAACAQRAEQPENRISHRSLQDNKVMCMSHLLT